MGELVARYALSRRQVLELDAVPQSLLDELIEHEARGRRIIHSVDAKREVLVYTVYEGDPDPSQGRRDAYVPPESVQVFVSLQASLLALGISSSSDDIKAIRAAGVLPFTKASGQ